MLPSTIAVEFAESVWTPIPDLNGPGHPVAEVKLLPYTYDDLLEAYEHFGICRQCEGNRLLSTPSNGKDGAMVHRQLCPSCKDKPGKSSLDADVRRYLISKHVLDWRNVFTMDPLTGEVAPLPFGEKARSGLAAVLPIFLAVAGAAQRLGSVQDAAKKGFTTPLPDGSGTAEQAAGALG